MHPHYGVDGGFDVGVAWLMSDAAMRPASMYDGGDLGINDCTRMTMSYLGWGADDMLKRAGMGLFDYDECKDMYHWATGMHVALALPLFLFFFFFLGGLLVLCVGDVLETCVSVCRCVGVS
eukprot:3790320-Rhodomonas_salina.1